MAEQPPDAPNHALKIAPLAALVLGHAVSDACINFVPPMWPVFQERYGLSTAGVGLLTAFVSLTTNFGQPLFGYLADRFKVQHMVAIGPALAGLFVGLMGLAPNVAVLGVFYVVAGAGTALFHPQGATFAGAVSGQRRGAGMAVFSAGGALGYASGALISVALFEWLGLHGMLGALVLGAGTGLLLSMVNPGRRLIDRAAAPLRLRRDVLPYLSKVGLLFTVVTLRSAVVIVFISFLSLLVKEWGHSVAVGGFAIFLMVFVGGIGNFLGGVLSDYLGRRNLTVITLILSAPLFYAFMRLGVPAGYPALALGNFLCQASVSVNIVQGQELLPAGPGVASSLTMGAAWGVAGLVAPVVGWAAEIWGLASVMMLVAWVPILPGLLALWVPDRAEAITPA
jgi:FSR family fosmidomycin resistance protein-like MFS transporter